MSRPTSEDVYFRSFCPKYSLISGLAAVADLLQEKLYNADCVADDCETGDIFCCPEKCGRLIDNNNKIWRHCKPEWGNGNH